MDFNQWKALKGVQRSDMCSPHFPLSEPRCPSASVPLPLVTPPCMPYLWSLPHSVIHFCLPHLAIIVIESTWPLLLPLSVCTLIPHWFFVLCLCPCKSSPIKCSSVPPSRSSESCQELDNTSAFVGFFPFPFSLYFPQFFFLF